MLELVNILSQINRAFRQKDSVFYVKKTKKARNVLQALVKGGILTGFVGNKRGNFIVYSKVPVHSNHLPFKQIFLLSKPIQIKYFTVYKLKSLLWKKRRVQVLMSTSCDQICVLDWNTYNARRLQGGIVLGWISS